MKLIYENDLSNLIKSDFNIISYNIYALTLKERKIHRRELINNIAVNNHEIVEKSLINDNLFNDHSEISKNTHFNDISDKYSYIICNR